jgi:hypothetical protein
MIRITLACPADLFEDYVQLRRCLMPSAAEADAPPEPVFAWQGADGGLFIVSSVVVSMAWLGGTQALLITPPWGADMAAAGRAQAAIDLWQGTGAAPVAAVGSITVVLDMEGAEALNAIGLAPTESDPLI